MKKIPSAVADLCFFAGSVLLGLWLLYLLFLVFFWTGMGLRDGPPPPASIYWKEIFRTLCFILFGAATKLWFVTWPLLIAVGFGWHERRQRKNA
jgi:hypothetical protein